MAEKSEIVETGTFAFRAALAEAKLSQTDLAEIIDVTTRNVNRWYCGDIPVPRYVMVILSLLNGQNRHHAKIGALKKYRVTSAIVYRGKPYKSVAMTFHPDRSGWDSKSEMQIVNALKE